MSTKIEWTDEVWNPIVGCSKISEGCQNCYAEKMARRLVSMRNEKYFGTVDHFFLMKKIKRGWTGRTVFHRDTLTKPRSWKKPRKVFVNSMGDLFHDENKFDAIHEIWDVMKSCPQHIFQVLTKRPLNMRKCIKKIYSLERLGWAKGFWNHVWLGVTVENKFHVDRIETLREIPAAVRFVSLEPLLGPVDLSKYLMNCLGCGNNGSSAYIIGHENQLCRSCEERKEGPSIDWVIVGGENGPGARPMSIDWARDIRDQCQEAGVPFFYKGPGGVRKPRHRVLDGREWNEFPKGDQND